MTNEQKLSCPNCGTVIDVNSFVYEQVENKLKEETKKIQFNYEQIDLEKSKKFEQEKNELVIKFNNEKNQLENQKKIFEQEKNNFQLNFENELKNQLNAERKIIESQTKQKIYDEKKYEIDKLNDEIKSYREKEKENIELKLKLQHIEQEKELLHNKITLEKEQEYREKLNAEQSKIREEIENKHYLKNKEYEKQLEDQRKLIDEMKRKAEQGSMQLQGEIQELELENLIKNNFPTDKMEEIKKGQRGADVVHKVYNDFYQCCGTIYYESKRTKSFSEQWINKLKDDNKEIQADILVIVSETLPQNRNNFYYENGVWICSFVDIKLLIQVLRQSLIEVQKVKIVNKNSEDKQILLYNFLTSNEFKSQLDYIFRSFDELRKNHQDEKNRLTKIWAQREKSLEKIINNTFAFYGSICGIAGQNIPNIPYLEESEKLMLDE